MNSEIEPHITKKYEIKKRLGKGAYGIVWKAIDKRTSEVVAVKKIFDAFRNQTDAQRTFREIMFLQEFEDHPNIIKLHNVIKAENDKDIYLIFEFMETDLHNVIKRGNILKDVHKRYIMYQLFKSTKYIHSGNVIHRDEKCPRYFFIVPLQPSNVLLDSDCMIKICDFGLARSLKQIGMDETGDPNLTEYVATRWYRAPEILLASHRYTKGVDMWSLGCILGEMLLGKPLFPGSSTLNQIEKIMGVISSPSKEDIESLKSAYGSSVLGKANIKQKKSLDEMLSDAPADAVDLVKRLLHFNPDKRITATEALKHPYVSRFHNPEEEIALDYDVVPSLSDEVQLTVEEYRQKLYEMMMEKKAARRRKRREEKQMQNVLLDYHTVHKAALPDVVPPTDGIQKENNQSPISVSPKGSHHKFSQNSNVVFGRTTHESLPPPQRRLRPVSRQFQAHSNTVLPTSSPENARNRFVSAPPGGRGRSRPISAALHQNNPIITRDDKKSLTVTSSRLVPGQRPISAKEHIKPVYGRRQFNNAVNNPSTGAPKVGFGSYSQAYGTITSSGLALLQGKKA